MVGKAIGLFCLILVAASTSFAGQGWQGRVVSVESGNLLTVRDGQGERRAVRLYGIDAPDGGQAMSDQARDLLAAMVLDKEVEVRGEGPVTAARVFLGGVSINAAMVKAGYAWVHEPSCRHEDCAAWRGYQQFAGKNGKGLWAESGAVPPWEWRERRSRAMAKATRITAENQYATYYGVQSRAETTIRAAAPSPTVVVRRYASAPRKPAIGRGRS